MELNFFANTLDLKTKDFLFYQSIWGHKKNITSSFLNLHILGFRNDFALFNSEHLLEYTKRCLLFSFKTIFDNGHFLFLNIINSYKKINAFFCFRSVQPLLYSKWVNGNFTNNVLRKPFVLLCPLINNNIIKEAFLKLVPVIYFEDTNFNLNKGFYSILGNDDSKKSIYLFYSFFSSFILKSFLLRFFKKNTL